MSVKGIKDNKCLEEINIDVESLKAEIMRATLELSFPIGQSYITQEDINPATILGFGTWERLKGRVQVGLEEGVESFDTIGKIGGESLHTLTEYEIPAHTHGSAQLTGDIYLSGTIPMCSNDDTKTMGANGICSVGTGKSTPPLTDMTGTASSKTNLVNINATHEHNSVGGNQAHNNLQPYYVVGYMWVRTA